MSSPSENAKLAELHAKTDRELIEVAARVLERGLNAARSVAVQSNGCVRTLRVDAERAYAEAVKLLSFVRYLDPEATRPVEQAMAELRRMLDRMPAKQRNTAAA